MEIIRGKGVNGHMVRGKLRIIRHIQHTAAHNFTDPATEKIRFQDACETVKRELTELQLQTVEKASEKEAEIFVIHQMMIEDDEFRENVYHWIENGKSAEEAVSHVGEILARNFSSMDNLYMQARASDIRSVSGRIADVLIGREATDFHTDEPVIIAADDLTPAETVMLDKKMILGFVTENGSENSHTAILARTMDIPAVVSIGIIEDRYDGLECILDGNNGILYINPDEEVCRVCDDSCMYDRQKKNETEQYRGVRCVTPEGTAIQICANTGGIEDVIEAAANDAEGIGLFRSEFLFMRYDRCPTEDEQFEVYREAVYHMAGKETVIRTLDAGADKQLKWLPKTAKESNPALGLRAVRLCLRHSALLYTQLRALYRASAFGPIAVMIPMITIPDELKQVRLIAKQAVETLRLENIEYDPYMPIGIMIETPSAALYAEELAESADFFSIGTNDLIQYTLAADRENPEIEYLTKPLPESVMKLMEMAASAGKKAGIPVGICGELGTDAALIPFFLDIGITKISVSPARILRVRGDVLKRIDEESICKEKDCIK